MKSESKIKREIVQGKIAHRISHEITGQGKRLCINPLNYLFFGLEEA